MKVKAILNSGYFANTRHATNYIAYIDRQSPIFDQNGTEKKVLSAQVEVEAPGNSTVWRHVYSLNASDCERLGVDRNYMKNLIALKADELAIQQAIICQVLAHELEINPRALDNYRRAAVEYLKMNDRVFRLEDILEE